MTAKHVSTRIHDAETARVPTRPTGYNARLSLGVGIAIFALAVIFAIVAEPNVIGLLVVSLALTFLFIAVGASVMQVGLRDRSVRINPSAQTLRFEGSQAGVMFFAAAAVVQIVPGLLVVTAWLTDGLQLPGVALIALSLVGLVWLTQIIVSLRTPAGLTLSVSGIRGVRGTKNVDLRWDSLLGAGVIFVKDSRLVLSLTTGGTILIAPQYTGSDPNVVAAVLNYYRAHPEHRALLANPRGALDHVEAALAD